MPRTYLIQVHLLIIVAVGQLFRSLGLADLSIHLCALGLQHSESCFIGMLS